MQRLRGVAAVVGLLAVPLLVFAPVALVKRAFYVFDVHFYFYPYHKAAAEIVSNGFLPLWNPLQFSGIPLFGDGQTAMLYPPNWLFHLLPSTAALNFDFLLQFWIAGFGTYLAARSLGAGRIPALVGGITYMLGGFMTSRVVHLSIQSGAAMIPWVFLCTHQALRGESARWFAAAAFVVALQVLTGHPQLPVYTAGAMFLLAVVSTLERRSKGDAGLYRPIWRTVGIYALGYGLAAVQIVPWLELASFSPRAASVDDEFVLRYSMAARDWLLLLFPYLRGSIGSGFYATEALPLGAAVGLWERTAYVGILPLALAATGLLGLAKRREHSVDAESDASRRLWFSVLFFAVLLVGAVLFAAGKNTPFGKIITALPVIGSLRAPARALALASFAVAVLAALGMQSLVYCRENVAKGSLGAIAAASVLLPTSLVFLSSLPWLTEWLGLAAGEHFNLGLDRRGTVVPLAFAFASGALLMLWRYRAPGRVGVVVGVGLLLCDLGSFAALFNPTTDASLYADPPAVVTSLRGDSGSYRKLSVVSSSWNDAELSKGTLSGSWAMAHGIEDANGFNSLQPRRYTDYLFSSNREDVSYGSFNDIRVLDPNWPVPHTLNVKYLLFPANSRFATPDHLRFVYRDEFVVVYENTLVLPRAYFVESFRIEDDPTKILEAVTSSGFDVRRVTLVEGRPPQLEPASVETAHVAVIKHSPNRIELKASATTDRLLVLSEMHFPGWRAYVDGTETDIYRANYLFRSIVVPAGEHRIEFVYRPKSVMLGFSISAVSLAIASWLIGPLSFLRRSIQYRRGETRGSMP